MRRLARGNQSNDVGVGRPASSNSSCGRYDRIPRLERREMLRLLAHFHDRHLMRSPGSFDGKAVDLFGAVQPFGVRRTIIGQRARVLSPSTRARDCSARISLSTWSSVAASVLVNERGSSPADEIRLQPQPTSRSVSSRSEMRSEHCRVGDLVAVQVQDGSTAPIADRVRETCSNCQLVASGPVSASPSPITHATTRSGLSNAAPKA